MLYTLADILTFCVVRVFNRCLKYFKMDVAITCDELNQWAFYVLYACVGTTATILIGWIFILMLRQYFYWKYRGCSQEWPIFFFGNAYYSIMGKRSHTIELDRLFHSTIGVQENGHRKPLGYHEFLTPIKMWRQKDQFDRLAQMLRKRPLNFHPSIDPLWANSAFAMRIGDRAYQIFNMFSLSKILFEEKEAHANIMITEINLFIQEHLDSDKKNVDMKDLCLKLSNRILAHCFYDVAYLRSLNLNVSKYLLDCKCDNFRGRKNHLKYLMYANFPYLAKLLRLRFFDHKATIEYQDFVRYSSNVNQNTLASKMVRAYDISLPEEEYQKEKIDIIAAQLATSFIVGSDTISTTLAFIFYELAMSSELQQRTYERLPNYWHDWDSKTNPKIESLVQNSSAHLDKLVKDVLRKWPPISILDKFDPYSNHCVQIPIYSVQNDRRFYNDAEKINPERYQPHDDNFVFLSFGTDNKKCPGESLALQTLKFVTVLFLTKFEFQKNNTTEEPLRLNVNERNVFPANGIFLDIKCRQTAETSSVESGRV